MSHFKSRDSAYEELDPLVPGGSPRRGQRKCWNYALVGLLAGGIATLVTVLVVTSFSGPADGTGPEPAPNNQTPVLRASGSSSYVLKAEGDPTPEEDILLDLDMGSLRGKRMRSRGGRDYLAFTGIPYAKPPIGELRFQPPVEGEPWEGTLNATTLTPECMQKDKYNVNASVYKGSEDCLYLNVYTPKNLSELGRRRGRLPVMVYLHGGGPFGNSSRYGGDYLMDADVIFITVHYRLGALGNLNTNDSAARGNQGLKDQVLSLQWAKDNIRKFGGDRRKVTLFGNSYGGMEVAAHLLSPMSKGLFHRAICQSGVVIMPGMISANPRHSAFLLGAKFNCSQTNSTELVECLKGVGAGEMCLSSYAMDFTTSVDAPSESGDDLFLPDQPLTLLQAGDINPMPVIFGVNSGEGLFSSLAILLSPNLTEGLNEDWSSTVADSLNLRMTSERPEEIADAARDFYFGDRNVSRATVTNLTNMFSDRDFVHPATVFASFQSQYNGRRDEVFLYHFNRKVAKKYTAALEKSYEPEEFLGASHADELQLLFPYDDYPYVSLDSEYANISLTMIQLWTSFAASGKPSGTTNEWVGIESEQKPYGWFQLDDSPRMIDTLGPRMAFWDSFNITELYSTRPDQTEAPQI